MARVNFLNVQENISCIQQVYITDEDVECKGIVQALFDAIPKGYRLINVLNQRYDGEKQRYTLDVSVVKVLTLTMDAALQLAASLWAKPEHANKVMDPDFAKSIALLLMRVT